VKISNGSKLLIVLALTAPILAIAMARPSNRVQITFTGGHETDRRDGGRPVALVAGALGVPTEVFREAFSHVTPARGRAPEPGQVHMNKRALLDALGKYGITNDRLDEVSDYYRYQPERRQMWPVRSAKGYATVEKGKVISITITDAGSGYTSTPTATFEGMNVKTTVKLAFSKRFEANGSVASVQPATP
jgi:hypothetical protein